MPLNKTKGNMYDWITHTWPVGRGCAHDCSYCYVKSIPGSDIGTHFIPQAKPDLGRDKTIFVGNCIDLFSEEMDSRDIESVLRHFQKYPLNRYVFQTKNPERMYGYLSAMPQAMPGQSILGTTIESDDAALLAKHSKAPEPTQRALWIGSCKDAGFKTFLTIEPIMRCDPQKLAALVVAANPTWVNIGADSKNNNLPEPTPSEINVLITMLKQNGFEIKLKPNLKRIYNLS